jgi:hypothetical protein
VEREQIRRYVLAAVARGDIPRGGPSELAAHDLLDHVPQDYWQRWCRETADRIRATLPPYRREPGEGKSWWWE